VSNLNLFALKDACTFTYEIKKASIRGNVQRIHFFTTTDNAYYLDFHFVTSILDYNRQESNGVNPILNCLSYVFKAHLQELLKSRFSLNRDLNFMLSLSVRFNLTKTE
jgi:hypothetical protein